MTTGPSNVSETRRRALRLAFPEPAERPSIVTTRLLRSGEVAALLQVSRRSIAAWASRGLIPFIETPGGHRRFRATDVRALIAALERDAIDVDPTEAASSHRSS